MCTYRIKYIYIYLYDYTYIYTHTYIHPGRHLKLVFVP